MNAIYPASFDPCHLGHIYIARQAKGICDHLHVVESNQDKDHMFDGRQREYILRKSMRRAFEDRWDEVTVDRGVLSVLIYFWMNPDEAGGFWEGHDNEDGS